MADYKLRLTDREGLHVGEICGRGDSDPAGELAPFLTLAVSREVNKPGVCMFTLPGNHMAVSLLEDMGQVEVWRRDLTADPVLPWYREFAAFYRGQDWKYTDRESFLATCPGQMALLSRRHVLWPAQTANRSAFTNKPAETIAKLLVRYNATTEATVVAGRLRDGALSGFTITAAADGGAGTERDWYCAYDNLLETLQELAKAGAGDFDLVKTAATEWEFRWYDGQLGTDRSADIRYSLAQGNMLDPAYSYNPLNEKTVAVALGRGEGAARAWQEATGANYSADNDIETAVSATDVTTDAGLVARAAAKLEGLQARGAFSFRTRETPEIRYGRDVFLGDRVKATYRGFDGAVQARAVTIALDASGDEKVELRMEAV
jgi:hypothetical protein